MNIKVPARVCLFGDHQDYLGLPVITCAINRFIELKAKPNHSDKIRIDLPDISSSRIIDLNKDFKVIAKRDYFSSGIRLMSNLGYRIDKGYDLEIIGDIPINAGLSSSSALCAAWIIFLCKALNVQGLTCLDLANLIYRAEVTEHNEPGGNMDQFAISFGNVQYIETRKPFNVKQVEQAIPGLVIADSGIEKKTLETLGKGREKGNDVLEKAEKVIPNFDRYNSTQEQVQGHEHLFSNEEKSYLKAALINHDITRMALSLMESQPLDWNEIGKLMHAHHQILSQELEISLPQIDTMIAAALHAGALGAKIVGSGKGGCVVAIAPGKEEEVKKAFLESGAKESFTCSQSAGAFELNF